MGYFHWLLPRLGPCQALKLHPGFHAALCFQPCGQPSGFEASLMLEESGRGENPSAESSSSGIWDQLYLRFDEELCHSIDGPLIEPRALAIRTDSSGVAH